VADDPCTDPVTRVLLNKKLALATATELEAAERDITHAVFVLLGESPAHPGYDLQLTSCWPDGPGSPSTRHICENNYRNGKVIRLDGALRFPPQ
jgi:hypothetical protein